MKGQTCRDILGVYEKVEDAQTQMKADIDQMKKDWNHLDFDDPEDWIIGGDSKNGYEAMDSSYEYQYAIWIETKVIQ